jgi:linoleate 8R-lipoxygenase/9,12-octadecadienoate 8-hydroperoxide 8R-isomerase
MASKSGAVDTSSTEHNAWRKEIEKSLKSVKQLIHKSNAPIPTIQYEPLNDPDKQKLTSLFHDLHKFGLDDLKTLLDLFSSEIKGYQNDDKFVLERLVKLLGKLGADSKVSNSLTGGFINNLWAALPHPPLSSLGKKYQYRDADGANNNIRIPDLGAAGSPYARSATPIILQNIALPDPGVIFDSLMDRGSKFEAHPNKISSMLFYLATIIIHDIFRTVSIFLCIFFDPD